MLFTNYCEARIVRGEDTFNNKKIIVSYFSNNEFDQLKPLRKLSLKKIAYFNSKPQYLLYAEMTSTFGSNQLSTLDDSEIKFNNDPLNTQRIIRTGELDEGHPSVSFSISQDIIDKILNSDTVSINFAMKFSDPLLVKYKPYEIPRPILDEWKQIISETTN